MSFAFCQVFVVHCRGQRSLFSSTNGDPFHLHFRCATLDVSCMPCESFQRFRFLIPSFPAEQWETFLPPCTHKACLRLHPVHVLFKPKFFHPVHVARRNVLLFRFPLRPLPTE